MWLEMLVSFSFNVELCIRPSSESWSHWFNRPSLNRLGRFLDSRSSLCFTQRIYHDSHRSRLRAKRETNGGFGAWHRWLAVSFHSATSLWRVTRAEEALFSWSWHIRLVAILVALVELYSIFHEQFRESKRQCGLETLDKLPRYNTYIVDKMVIKYGI